MEFLEEASNPISKNAQKIGKSQEQKPEVVLPDLPELEETQIVVFKKKIIQPILQKTEVGQEKPNLKYQKVINPKTLKQYRYGSQERCW